MVAYPADILHQYPDRLNGIRYRFGMIPFCRPDIRENHVRPIYWTVAGRVVHARRSRPTCHRLADRVFWHGSTQCIRVLSIDGWKEVNDD